MAEGSAANKPVIEVALQLEQTSAPTLHPPTAQPINADVTARASRFERFFAQALAGAFPRDAGGGRPHRHHAGARAAGRNPSRSAAAALSLTANGRLEGQLRVTVAGLDQLLAAIGAQQRVQTRRTWTSSCGALDRLAPGLGEVARQQAGRQYRRSASICSASRPRSRASARWRCRCVSRRCGVPRADSDRQRAGIVLGQTA